MYIVMVGARPKGDEVMQAPGKLVAAVSVDGLEEPEGDPEIHGQDVQIAGDSTP